MRKTLVAVTIALVTATASLAGPDASARNWGQWRGPLATGEAPHGKPPITWSEKKNVRFKVPLEGTGLSTPIIWGEQIFLTTAIKTAVEVEGKKMPEGASKRRKWMEPVEPTHVVEFAVLALDRKDGSTVWRKTVRRAAPHEGTHGHASWASNSAVTDGETLIAHFGSSGTYAFELSGKLLWEKDLGDMRTRNGFGEGSSPAIHGSTVIINWDHEGDSFIVALDKKTGEERWRQSRDEVTSWSTPVVVTGDGKPQVVVAATGATRGYDLATGEVLWESTGMTTNTIPSPVYAGGRVFVMSGFRGAALQAIDLGEASGDISTGDGIAWGYEKDTPYVPSPLLYRDQLLFLKGNKGILTSLDAGSGKPVYSRQRLEGIDGVYASLVGANGYVYIVGRNGTTLVLEHGDSFEVAASNELDDRFDASPAIVGDTLYLRGHQHLYAIAE